MDPNTDTINSNPYEPTDNLASSPADPVIESQTTPSSDPEPLAAAPDPATDTDSPSEPILPHPPSSVIAPTQDLTSPTVSTSTVTPDASEATDPLVVSSDAQPANPPTDSVEPATNPPDAPVIVSGGFQGGGPASPLADTADASSAASTPPPSSPSKKGRLKPLLIALLVIIVLAGGSAAAYVGVIVPNQPANVLKTSIFNSLKQNSISYKATINYQSTGGSSSIPPFQLSLSGSKNGTAKTSNVVLAAGAEGVDISLESRLVNQNLYIKPGDLSPLAALASKYDPSLAPTATTLSKDLSNQWIEVDQSLLDEAGLSCFLNTNYLSLSQADINLLTSDYSKHDFLNIQKTTSTTLDGQAAEEFQVNIQENTAAGFINNLGNLSEVKSLEACKGGSGISSALAKVTGPNKTTPLTIWVSKGNKQIIQMSLPESQKDITSYHATVTDSLTFNYNNVTITAPSNAESVLQLYTKLAPTLQSALGSSGLNLNSLLSGLNSKTSSGISL